MAKKRFERWYADELHIIVFSLFEDFEELGLTTTEVAIKAGLGVQTVDNLRRWVTRWPQLRTILGIARAMNKPLDMAKAKKRWKSAGLRKLKLVS